MRRRRLRTKWRSKQGNRKWGRRSFGPLLRKHERAKNRDQNQDGSGLKWKQIFLEQHRGELACGNSSLTWRSCAIRHRRADGRMRHAVRQPEEEKNRQREAGLF